MNLEPRVSCASHNSLPRTKNKKRQKELGLNVQALFSIPPSATSCTHRLPCRFGRCFCTSCRGLHRRPAPLNTLRVPRSLNHFTQCQNKNGHLSVTVFDLAGAEGLEPSARGFGDRCSTNWAIPLNIWWAIRDSNPGPTGYEPVALTNWANGPHERVTIKWLEYNITKSPDCQHFLFDKS